MSIPADVAGTGPETDQLLRLQGVTKRYQRGEEEVVAVNRVDLAMHPNDVVAVAGRSGSGKSTLLHLAAGLDQPDEGEVLFESAPVATMSFRERAQLRRRKIGLVFQFFNLLPSLSVTENVELPLLLDRRRDDEGRVAELLDQLGISHRAAHFPAQLSGGEMQRVAIARALITRPRLVLADEPTGNLDSATGAAILDLLIEVVNTTGAALLLVTHDRAAEARADRVLHLSDGRLTQAR